MLEMRLEISKRTPCCGSIVNAYKLYRKRAGNVFYQPLEDLIYISSLDLNTMLTGNLSEEDIADFHAILDPLNDFSN